MGLTFEYLDGQTPLDEEEMEGILIPSISTRSDLDEFEQQNIELAIEWSMGSNIQAKKIFTIDFIKKVHFQMFGNTWKWAGEFRKTNKNLGVEHWKINSELKYLQDNATYWKEHNTYPADEIAIRFKHQIVSIHCFSNGNGRHSRLMADLIIDKMFQLPVFTWGAHRKQSPKETRRAYLHALKKADVGNYVQLMEFARS